MSRRVRRMPLAEVGIVCGTLPWVWLTLRSGGGDHAAQGAVSLVPLKDLVTMPTYQVVGNLLVFAAFGLLAPVRFKVLASIPRVAAVAAAGSLLIETIQYLAHQGRVSSVDDVLLNTAGAALAAVTSRRWWRSTSRAGSGRVQ